MYSHYFYWQYLVAPRFLLRFLWTLQQMLLQMFSVRLMITTLLAHWHREAVAYRQGSLTGLLQAAALNAISRAVGFIVRSIVLLLWLVVEMFFLLLAAGTFLGFLLAPILALVSIAYGLWLIRL